MESNSTFLLDKNRDYAQVLEERNQADSLLVKYVFGDDLISQKRDSLTYFYHTDGQLSTRQLTDGSQNITDTYTYDAFGLLLNQTGGTENNFLYTGEQYDPNVGFYYLRARYYKSSIGRWLAPDPAGQFWSPYIFCGNRPLVYIDEDGELAWFVPVIIGAAVGATAGGIIAHNNGIDWWKGAITGAFLGAGVGTLIAPAIGATGITTAAGASTTSWGITTSIINSANINMAIGSVTGAKADELWKFGLVGAASGGFAATGGFGLAKSGFWGRLAYQGINTAGRSIGNNWARGVAPLSRVTLGIGPVNFTLGKGQKLLQWKNNIGNIIFNSVGLANMLTGGKFEFSWSHLTPNYRGGLLGKLYSKFGTLATGAHAVLSQEPYDINTEVFGHELHHIWMSRAFGDHFLFNDIAAGLYSIIMGGGIFDYSNFHETIAYDHQWGY